ncbi:MAG: heterodisulfide reductase subunit B, partial [Sulfurimonas sp.]|nr:heterodisulfide reductase subunit B [Sulfurimonas sp.]
KCCGFHVELQAPHTAAKLSGTAIAGATDQNADMMVTPCPLCHLKLDTQTKHSSEAVGREVALPVLHMQQMIGLALGCTNEELGLKHHVTEVGFA